ncbi:LysR family transcriptional regulator [Azospirillum thermophilum]|uniref:LysR family transcriptional regulator n=1 Tax=Azospirillum thermophilum TaxID=2202148 RepID=A0A2S2CQH5_9PROT|nr:LysR family transcriptional regulator [Azospirillum thermophilum]AWK86784.1 LysR family transcriptional regulator [Azospirillum thermophilum]
MRSLSPDQLRSYLTVVESGSFQAAARRLNLTQPAVSLQIRELESRLGVRLLDREGRQAVPTPAGQTLLTRARRILAEIDSALEAMERHRTGSLGRLRLGSGTSVATHLLPAALKRLRERFPGLEITVSTGTAGEIVRRLLDNDFDLAVVTLPVTEDGLEIEPLRDQPAVAILPADLPGAAGLPERVSPADLARFPLILDQRPSRLGQLTAAWFESGGVQPRPIMELASYAAIRSMVAAGMGASVVTSDLVAEAGAPLIVRPLDPPLVVRLAIARRLGQPADPALTLACQALRDLSGPPGFCRHGL